MGVAYLYGVYVPRHKLVLHEMRGNAVREARKLRAEGISLREVQARLVTFSGAAEEFFERYCSKKRSKEGFANSIRHLTGFFGNKKLLDIEVLDVVEYAEKRTDEGAAPASINRELACLKRMLSWIETVKERPIPFPISKIKLLEGEIMKERILTFDEKNALLKCCPDHLRLVVFTALLTGMRKGEILSLEWRDVDFKRNLIKIRMENSKSKRSREVPVCDDLRQMLNAMPLSGRYVFTNPDTGTRYYTLDRSFKMALYKAGIKDARFHDLRHTFASDMIRAGVPAAQLQKWLGHASIMTTMRYVHLDPKNEMDKINEIAREITNKTATPENVVRTVVRAPSQTSLFGDKGHSLSN